MTAITAAAPPPLAPVAAPSVAPATTAVVPAGPPPRAETPAVINDVARLAASTTTSAARAVDGDNTPTTLRGRVGRVLEDIGGVNASVQANKTIAWDVIEAKFGKAKMEENKRIHAHWDAVNAGFASRGVAELQREPGVSGLSVTRQEDGSLKVGEFSFTDAGSTYTIKQGTDGRMIGLKDGLGWKTWQVEPPASSKPGRGGAETALATLTALAAGQGAKPPVDLLT